MDQEIHARLKERHYREAFELLMPRYQNKVFRLAYSMLGNTALAEETTQDIFIRIWKALACYRGQSSISTWIYTIARNACLTAMKVNAARPVPLEQTQVKLPSRASGAHGIDWEHLLSQLPEKYRQVLVLFYMEDKAYDEVAKLLDLPMGTVKTYLHRARKDLAAAVMESKMAKGGR
jgi:RNA polymerase sigma-70 factor (ECF subfamily)